MTTSTKITFLVHAIVALIFGLIMLIIPGRFLEFLTWDPIDPIAGRLLGAALLALSWASYRSYVANEWSKVSIVVELETIFTVLASVGLLRHLLVGRWPWYPWTLLAIFAIFAIAWIIALVRK
jgi:hypothetical protein